jgi:hypothetical protein
VLVDKDDGAHAGCTTKQVNQAMGALETQRQVKSRVVAGATATSRTKKWWPVEE